jgi:hypothetical protein
MQLLGTFRLRIRYVYQQAILLVLAKSLRPDGLSYKIRYKRTTRVGSYKPPPRESSEDGGGAV